MALVISIKDGEDFYVQDTRFIVKSVSQYDFVVQPVGGVKTILVTDLRMQEIMPGVLVSCGLGNFIDGGKYTARVVFEAPREFIILRGDIYRRSR